MSMRKFIQNTARAAIFIGLATGIHTVAYLNKAEHVNTAFTTDNPISWLFIIGFGALGLYFFFASDNEEAHYAKGK